MSILLQYRNRRLKNSTLISPGVLCVISCESIPFHPELGSRSPTHYWGGQSRIPPNMSGDSLDAVDVRWSDPEACGTPPPSSLGSWSAFSSAIQRTKIISNGLLLHPIYLCSLPHCIAEIVYFLDQHEVVVNSMHTRTLKAHLLLWRRRNVLWIVSWVHLLVLGVIETNYSVLLDVIRRRAPHLRVAPSNEPNYWPRYPYVLEVPLHNWGLYEELEMV